MVLAQVGITGCAHTRAALPEAVFAAFSRDENNSGLGRVGRTISLSPNFWLRFDVRQRYDWSIADMTLLMQAGRAFPKNVTVSNVTRGELKLAAQRVFSRYLSPVALSILQQALPSVVAVPIPVFEDPMVYATGFSNSTTAAEVSPNSTDAVGFSPTASPARRFAFNGYLAFNRWFGDGNVYVTVNGYAMPVTQLLPVQAALADLESGFSISLSTWLGRHSRIGRHVSKRFVSPLHTLWMR